MGVSGGCMIEKNRRTESIRARRVRHTPPAPQMQTGGTRLQKSPFDLANPRLESRHADATEESHGFASADREAAEFETKS